MASITPKVSTNLENNSLTALSGSDEATASNGASNAKTNSKNNPFSVVEAAPGTSDTQNKVSDSEEETAVFSDQKSPIISTNETAIIRPPPEGYSVEDAMKYFVPKGQRSAGNLGGPPPPAFMVPENADGVRSIESLLPPVPTE